MGDLLDTVEQIGSESEMLSAVERIDPGSCSHADWRIRDWADTVCQIEADGLSPFVVALRAIIVGE
jgi:hypothetical protein